MASKPSNGGGDGSRDKHRWSESKVYTRKSHNNKVSTKNIRQQQPPPPSSQTLTSDDGNNSFHPPPQLTRFEAVSDDDSSSPNHHQQQLGHSNNNRDPPFMNGFALRSENRITINISSKLKQELRELRRKLTKELDQVRNLVKKLEAKELQISSSYTQSQLSANYTIDNGGGGKREKFRAPLNRLSISIIEDSQGGLTDDVHKEKRTSKANQYYRNSEFVLGKEKFPPQESNKKSKTHGGKKNGEGNSGFGFGMEKNSGKVFKSCSELLGKLMKHKHGWVFNTPVDVKGLGLRDYYVIIKNPMDLGTVKNRLNKNGYQSPKDFAEDVKLTFHNAMSYNRKGQDVHIMAEELLKIFEDKWMVIQAKFNLDSRFEGDSEVGLLSKIRKRDHFPTPEKKRILDRSASTTVPVNSQVLTPLDVVASGRTAAQKKPKANEINKREMTYEEKQRLSSNLQRLPVEKLDNVVQIIKTRNSSLCQNDDEIEVDIDSVDTETLWELDRFVTNYKKSLSKNKRKAETAIRPREESEQKVLETNPYPAVVEEPKEIETVIDEDEKNVASSLPVQEEKQGDPASSSSSSSSDSGSSSSDSDSDSSSASDSGH